MAKKDDIEDDSDSFDDIDTTDDCKEDVSTTSVKYNYEARRRLETILEDKALDRLINGDFYD